MKNKVKTFILFLSALFLLWCPSKVKADTAINSASKVLLVYDSLNVRQGDQTEVETLTRMLMSMQRQVTATSMEDYKAGMLKNGKYDAVITMINWPEMDFKSHSYEQDLQKFTGKKLHIGPNLSGDEKNEFPGKWQQVSAQTLTLKGEHGYYNEDISFQTPIELLTEPSETEKTVGTLESQSVPKKTYSYGIINGNNAYLPLFDDQGASLLSSIQLISKWLGVKGNYSPYITVQNFTPLSSFKVAKKFVKDLNKIENNVIITTTSTTSNTDTQTFKDYLKFIKQMTRDNHAIIYLNVPAMNAKDSGNNDNLMNMLTQEISTFIENGIFPLGISAPTYWNFDRYYQMNALDFGDAVMLYNQDKDQYFHTKTKTSQVFPTTFFTIPHSALKNVHWKINGKYTEFTFPMPTTINYQFPKSEKQLEKMFAEITADPFPPTDGYLYQFSTGVSTQTQNLLGKDGVITLNDVPVNNINFDAIQHKATNVDNAQSNTTAVTSKRTVDKINDVLTVIIIGALIILGILLIKGRQLYLRMFKSRFAKTKEKEDQKGEK